MHNDYISAGFRVFPLWAFEGIRCDCEQPHCPAAGKHPRSSSWQHTPEWDDEQIEAMEQAGHFDSGFGVLCRGWLVIDVDARNGGMESFARLSADIPQIAQAGFIVSTGSGGGSRHMYFRAPADVALIQKHPDYPGLDFKSSGFVVGAGSRHVSGGMYEVGYGSPSDIDAAPDSLISLLRKPEKHRAEYDGHVVDVTEDDLSEMLSFIDPDCVYEEWIRIGMALHHATGGTGLAVWDAWSRNGRKYDAGVMDSHWHSFGRCLNPVTMGTLVHYAESAGWRMPVTFRPSDAVYNDFAAALPPDGLPFDISGVDLTAPPGFTGELARWIESQSRRPRKRLAVAAALVAMGNMSMRYTDDKDGVTSNLFAFCVAGSRTGKEAIQQAVSTIHKAAGIAPATHGAIKSEQEIIRNLVRHQAALYIIDEIGIFLQKIKNAQQKGGALYLDGVIGMLMAAYSKADSFLLLTGDMKDELRANLQKEAAQLEKRDDSSCDHRMAQIIAALDTIDQGLDRPFLSMIGFTTPVTFDELVDHHSATNGFIGRSLIFVERETAPRSKRGFTKRPMSALMQATLSQIYMAGHFDHQAGRVEFYGDRSVIPTEALAAGMLDDALDWCEDQAIAHKGQTGLEALYLGAYEIISKISMVLAVPSGSRTTEHVRWAFALVRRDLEDKARLCMANSSGGDARMALKSRIAHVIGDEDGETVRVIQRRLQKYRSEDIKRALDEMLDKGEVVCNDFSGAETRGQRVKKYRLS